MKHKIIILLISIPLLFICPLFPQSPTSQLSGTMQQIRQGKYFNGTAPFQKDIQNEASTIELINATLPYLKDTVSNVRAFAIELVHFAGRNSLSPNIRQMAVQNLVFACKDKGAGNSGKAGKALQQYKKEDFNVVARDSLATIIKRGVNALDQVFMIAGYIHLTGSIPDMKSALANPKINDKTKWAAHLALSRMGDEAETEYCIRVIKSKNMGNAIVYNMVPGLIYTRQKAAFDYLVTILNSDDKDCMSSNPDNPSQIVCGYRVMEFLAPVIKDFPLKTIKGVNQIKTDNYQKALETARTWFKEHANGYEIIDEGF
jgi:hypothetical protein